MVSDNINDYGFYYDKATDSIRPTKTLKESKFRASLLKGANELLSETAKENDHDEDK